jgi:hypothetical protein
VRCGAVVDRARAVRAHLCQRGFEASTNQERYPAAPALHVHARREVTFFFVVVGVDFGQLLVGRQVILTRTMMKKVAIQFFTATDLITMMELDVLCILDLVVAQLFNP